LITARLPFFSTKERALDESGGDRGRSVKVINHAGDEVQKVHFV